MLQNPSNSTPLLLPEGITDLIPLLENRTRQFGVASWMLPTDYENRLHQKFIEDVLPNTITATQLDKLVRNIASLCREWQLLVHSNLSLGKINYNTLRKAFNERAKKHIGGDSVIRGYWWLILSKLIGRAVYEPRQWLREVPGLKGLWFDSEQGYYLAGDLNNLNHTIARQPSVYRWHALRGKSRLKR